MNLEKKDDEQLPVYEVEFIPVERRLQERRSTPPAGLLPVERRQYGRRKSDLPAGEEPPAEPAPGEPSAPKEK